MIKTKVKTTHMLICLSLVIEAKMYSDIYPKRPGTVLLKYARSKRTAGIKCKPEFKSNINLLI